MKRSSPGTPLNYHSYTCILAVSLAVKCAGIRMGPFSKSQYYHSALKKLCALRTRSHWRRSSPCDAVLRWSLAVASRAFCAHLASLLFLSYGRLTCFNRLCSRCLSAWRSAFPSTSDHSLCSLRSAFLSTVCFPFAPHKLFQTSPHNAYPRALRIWRDICMPAKKKKKDFLAKFCNSFCLC